MDWDMNAIARRLINPEPPQPNPFPQSVGNYEPSWRDRLATALMGEAPTPLRKQMVERMTGSAGAGTQGMAPVDFVPGLGQAFGVNEAYREGDAQGMALAAAPLGIKAKLPADMASRMARADQMGFRRSMDLYHGSGRSFDEFNSVPTSARGWETPGVSLALDPAMANEFAMARSQGNAQANPQVYKLWHRADRPVDLNLTGKESHSEVVATLRDAFDNGADSVKLNNYTSPEGKSGDIIIVKDASQLRSPNAAFDPAKRESRNLLASLAGGGVLTMSVFDTLKPKGGE